MPLEPCDKAPDFTLLDQHGESFSLAKSLKQHKAPHLVYFYPQGRHAAGGTATNIRLAVREAASRQAELEPR